MFSVGYAQEGVVIVSEETAGSKTRLSTIYFTKDKMLVEDEKFTVMFDANNESLYNIDHKKREYLVLGKEDLQMLQQQMAAMMSMIEQQLKNLPPEQREMVKKNMKEAMPGMATEYSYVYKKVESGIEIKHWNTELYVEIVNEKKQAEFYIASFDQINLTKNDFAVFEKLKDLFQEFLEQFSGSLARHNASFLGIGGDDSPIMATGIPVKTIDYSSGKKGSEVIIQSIEKKKFASSIFDIPAGYKEVTLKEEMQGAMMGR